MQENYLVQKNHYDSQAIIEPADRLPWEFDENSSQYCLQGPYLFCRDWFTGKAHGKNILDFGCGARALSIFVFPPHGGATITGIDISPISVESAQNKAKHFDCSDQISFEVGNCEALPFEDDSFDYIFSAGTLSCLNLHKAFSEISRVLKPEGSAVLVDTLGHNPLLNFSRRLKKLRGLKTQWSVDHILKERDLQIAKDYFEQVDFRYFDLTTLFIAPLASLFKSQFKMLTKVAQRMDRCLLSLPFLRRYAFKVVCILSRPKIPSSLRPAYSTVEGN